MSHPIWVRGLKLFALESCIARNKVAPYMGAWIETSSKKPSPNFLYVAPYMGAWIETAQDNKSAGQRKVAPYMGAWIETIDP